MDLYEDTLIPLTFQINDLASLAGRQANFSPQFRIPKTQRNRTVLENPDLLQSPTKKPYQKLPARVVTDGLEIVPEGSGYAFIENTDLNYNVNVYSGNVDFFDLIDGLKLPDIDLSAYDQDWNKANILATRANDYTDGFKFPLIDYGDLSYNNRNVDVRNQRAAVFMKTLIDRIISDQGYSASGSIFSDSNFKKVLIPFANGKLAHGDRFKKQHSFNAKIPAAGTISAFGSLVYFAGLSDVSTPPYNDPSNQITLGAWTTSVGSAAYFDALEKVNIQFILKMRIGVVSWSDGVSSLDISLSGTGSVGIYSHPDSTQGGGAGVFDIAIQCTLTRLSGQKTSITVSMTNCAVSFPSGNIEGKVQDDIYFRLSTYDLEGNLPDMSQKELLSTFAHLYGVFFKIDPFTKTLYAVQFKDIVSKIPLAKDWSDKFHWENQNHKTDFKFGSYGQSNYLKFKKDTGDKDVTIDTGNGSFPIEDETLDKEKTMIQIPFAATHMEVSLLGVDVALIRKIESGEFRKSTEPRILIDDTKDIVGTPITYDDGILTQNESTDIPFCYFSLPGKTFNLDFEDYFIPQSYSELIACLKKARKITVQLNLDASDIANLDHFIPVYLSQLSAYFYVNKVINWTGKGLTKVELIRLQSDNETVPEIADEINNWDLQEDLNAELEEDDTEISEREGGN